MTLFFNFVYLEISWEKKTRIWSNRLYRLSRTPKLKSICWIGRMLMLFILNMQAVFFSHHNRHCQRHTAFHRSFSVRPLWSRVELFGRRGPCHAVAANYVSRGSDTNASQWATRLSVAQILSIIINHNHYVNYMRDPPAARSLPASRCSTWFGVNAPLFSVGLTAGGS